jgi:hypothetical protein
MAKVEVARIEEQRDHRLLFNVRVHTAEGRMDFPIGIQEMRSASLDEGAVLRSTLHFAEDLAASVQVLLAATPSNQ